MAEVIQSENKLQTRNQPIENKARNIFIIMDSNLKFICFKKQLGEDLCDPNASIITIPYGKIKKARNILKSQDIINPSKMLLHLGIK